MPNHLTAAKPTAPLPAPPDRVLSAGNYTVRFAANAAEVDEALRLRFEVFNLELGEGLESSYATARDRDHYDDHCHHLLVFQRDTNLVVGTYRMQTEAMAAAGAGFYADSEFFLDQLPKTVLEDSVEIGRACIAADHRNTIVLFLLWRGLAMYMAHTSNRFLFGCCSLTSQDPLEGQRALAHLRRSGHLHNQYWVGSRPEYACAGTLTETRERVKLPRLFRTYLKYGAKVCSPPAIDRMFKTIDYLVLLDMTSLDRRTLALFLP